jgi:hypothetical protein
MKMFTRDFIFYGIASLIVGLLLAMLIPAWIRPKPSRSKIVETVLIIRNCFYGIIAIEDESGEPIGQLMTGQSSSTNLNSELAKIFMRTEPDWAKRLMDSQRNHVVDAWKNPLIIMWRTNLAEVVSSAALRSRTDELVIWSVGQNGRNEFGNGDDVILPNGIAF